MKKIFTFFFALLSACTFSAYAAIVDGTCGYNLTWTLNTKDSTLVIAGEGEMTSTPWSDYKIYIKYVTIEDGVTNIGEYAFYNCSSLTSVTIPNSVTSIGESAFRYCSSLTSITIPNSVTSIGEGAFRDCDALTSITIPNSVTSIGNYAFYGCSSLTSPVYNAHCFAYMPTSYKGAYIIPEGIKQIAGGAFCYCSGLTSVTISESVTSIGDGAFYECSGLTSITIPNSVTSLGSDAFCECRSLRSVTIPNSVTSIGEGAFSWCSSLTSIKSLAEVPPTLGTGVFNKVSKDIPVYVPCSSVSAYQSAKGWQDFTNIQCMPEDESAVDNVHSQSANTQKILRDGQLLIIRDGKTYNAKGVELK